jgi:hypothetical protein
MNKEEIRKWREEQENKKFEDPNSVLNPKNFELRVKENQEYDKWCENYMTAHPDFYKHGNLRAIYDAEKNAPEICD